MDQGEFLAHVLGQGPGTLVLGEWSSGAIVPRRVSYPLPAGVVIQAPYFIPALEGAPINVIAADVDGADLTSLPATPSLIVTTSPHRYDVYYKSTDELTQDEALDYRQRIAPLSDVGEWFRVPGTINDKYPTNPSVEVVQAGLRAYSASVFSRLPEPNGSTLRNLPRLDWTPTGMGPNEFVKNELPASYGNWRNPKTSFDDLVDVLVEAKNLTEEQAVYIAFNAAANPYKKLTYGADRETAKHFMRRKLIKPYSSTITLDISRVRKAKGGAAFERRHEVTKLAMAEFMNRGQLIRARDNGDPWYVERATGQPIMLTPHSERLRTFITMSLGVNPVDVEHRHIAYDIIARGLSLQPTVETTHLSWYHSERNVLSVFLGGPRVIDISPNGLSFSSNAEQGVLFRVPPKFTIVPVDGIDLEAPKLDDWWEEFFPHFPNIVGADEEDVRSLLHVWLVFFLFRNAAEARPLLAMLGGWGSGKSATGRLFYRLLYGPTIGLHEVTSREAYDTAMSNYPLLLFDNVDRQREWLTERLATSISRIEEARRKLYTDNDVYSITGDAMVGVTAHDPPFLAGDIIDRLLYVHFRKLADNELIPEALFRDRVNANRERFLSGLLRDAQKVLQTPQPPKTSSTVSWRIADFAHFGSRIAEALGIRQQFDSALRNLLARQVSLTLEDDQILIDALMSYDRDSKTKMVWKSASQLWKELLEGDYVTDEMTFQRKYKNAGGLGRRLFSTLPMIRKVIPGMEFETDDRTGWRTWRIVPGGSNGKGATK